MSVAPSKTSRHTPEHLGSGLYIGRQADEEPRLRAVREGPGKWRAEVAGFKNETIVRTWRATETHPSCREAIEAARAAIAKAEGK